MADDSALYEIHDSPDAVGVGVFAKNDIASGTRIWQEEALFITRKSTLPDILEQFDAMERGKPEQYAKFRKLNHIGNALPNWERHLSQEETLASGLYPGYSAPQMNRERALAAKAYLERTDASGGIRIPKSEYAGSEFNMDHAGKWLSAFEFNAFPTPSNIGDRLSKGVFFTAAHLNHSCIPNCSPIWNPETEKFCVYAVRDISAGEELRVTYDYKDLNHLDRKERKLLTLRRYGFECKCLACDESSETSKRMDAISAHMYRIKPYLATSKEDHGNKGLDGEYKKVLKLMDEDASVDNWQKGTVHIMLFDLYRQWGDGDAKHHCAQAYEFAVRCIGEDHPYTKHFYAMWKKVDPLAT